MEPGTRLDPDEILEPLGKGGVSEVYRARDEILQRLPLIERPREACVEAGRGPTGYATIPSSGPGD